MSTTTKNIKTGIKLLEVGGKHFINAEYVFQLEDKALELVEEAIENCGPCDKCEGGCPNTMFRDTLKESIKISKEIGVRK